MSKSLQNFYTIDDVEKEGIDPSAMRLLFLQTHYRQTMNFTWESARAANTSYLKLQDQVRSLRQQTSRVELSPEKLEQLEVFQSDFTAALENDLNTPQAVAVMWKMIKSNIPSSDKLDLLMEWDKILGLGLALIKSSSPDTIPDEIVRLAEMRQTEKANKNFTASDMHRNKILAGGYEIIDTPNGYSITKK